MAEFGVAQTLCSAQGEADRRGANEEPVKLAVLARHKRLETVRAVEESDRPLKAEFAYLKLLSREYSGPAHRLGEPAS
jgi:hypothetical protein